MKKIHRLLAAVIVASGCTPATQYPSTPAYNRYTLEEVVQWSKAGDSPARIISRLDAASAFYPLRAGEIVRLHEEGVPTPVLDYLLDTYVRRVRYEERFQAPSRFDPQR